MLVRQLWPSKNTHEKQMVSAFFTHFRQTYDNIGHLSNFLKNKDHQKDSLCYDHMAQLPSLAWSVDPRTFWENTTTKTWGHTDWVLPLKSEHSSGPNGHRLLDLFLDIFPRVGMYDRTLRLSVLATHSAFHSLDDDTVFRDLHHFSVVCVCIIRHLHKSSFSTATAAGIWSCMPASASASVSGSTSSDDESS